ncbi:MAG: [citrate (pro-3S)-lyase] ligase, partial [Bacillota bacterium]
RAGTADLPNVYVHGTGPYMVSAALFPTYFLKDATQAATVHGNLDLRLFGARIAPALGITRRFVGTEPYSAVTADYNRLMKETLPAYGVEVAEIPRLAIDNAPISASRVRALCEKRDWEGIRSLVPAGTLSYLKSLGDG